MREKAKKMLDDIERVKKNPLAAGIGKRSGLFDALDNIAALQMELVERVESLSDVVVGGNNGK